MTTLENFQPSFDSYNSFLEHAQLDRFTKILYRYDLFKLVRNMPGDIVECGVYKGHGVLYWARLLQIFNPLSLRKVIGFDTFAGVPETVKDQQDIAGSKDFKNYSRLPEIIASQARELKINQRLELIAGDALTTIPAYIEANPGFRIALLNLDFDVFEPTLIALEYLYDRVIPGGVVCLDEYAVHNWGESKAFDEFVARRGIQVNLKTLPWALSPTAFFIKPH